MNADGWVMMDNAGCAGPAPYGTANPIDTLVIRDFLMHGARTLPPAWEPRDVQAVIEAGRGSEGGVLLAGDILVMSTPAAAGRDAGLLYEGDCRGGLVRTSGDPLVLPSGPRVGASNHFYRYRSDPRGYPCGSNPGATDGSPPVQGLGLCNGRAPSFSSMWRYQAGVGTLEAWARTGVTAGVEHMQHALAAMAEGETEHAIIAQPARMSFLLAVASRAQPMWDAPYLAWTELSFASLFPPP